MNNSTSIVRSEVKAAVDDILKGTAVDSHTEWLLREYTRLMNREAKMKSNLEPRCATNKPPSDDNGKQQPDSHKHRSSS